jgi:hypothetical protein
MAEEATGREGNLFPFHAMGPSYPGHLTPEPGFRISQAVGRGGKLKACIPAKPLSSSLDAKGGLADSSVVGQCITVTWESGSKKWASAIGMGGQIGGL